MERADKPRPEKAKVVEGLKEKFAKAAGVFIADYRGLTVEQVNNLRKAFRAAGVDYRVVKNTMVRRAIAGTPLDAIKGSLKGMTAVAFSGEEPGAAARVVKAFVKDNEKLKIKAGLLDGQVLDAKTVENQLATLPGKNEARAMLLATLMAPAQRFVMLLNTPAGNFVRLLEAKKAKG